MPGVLALAKREPADLLLAAQLVAVLAYPFMIDNEVGHSLISVFGIAILGLVVLAVHATPGLTWVTNAHRGPDGHAPALRRGGALVEQTPAVSGNMRATADRPHWIRRRDHGWSGDTGLHGTG